MTKNKSSHDVEEPALTLEEVKEQLVEEAKESGEISYEDITEKLSHYDIDPEEMDEFYEHLETQGVEIIDDDDEEEDTESTEDRKSTRLNSSHVAISYAVFCLTKKRRSGGPSRSS